MINVFADGYTIERENGEKVVLTPEEIHKISRAIDAAYGQDAVEYFIDCADSYESEDVINRAKKIMENEKDCANIWINYWDNITFDDGGVQYDTVLDYVVYDLRGEI